MEVKKSVSYSELGNTAAKKAALAYILYVSYNYADMRHLQF